MSKRPIHREQARRRTRLAQGAVVALALIAVALWFIAPAQLAADTRPVEPVEVSQATPGEDEPAEPAREIDFESIWTSLEQIANKPEPRPEEPEEVAATPDPNGSASPASAQPTNDNASEIMGRDIRYLGAIVEPDRIIALLSIDGTQRLARAGRTYDGVAVDEVTRDTVSVTVNGEPVTLERAEREGPNVTFTDGGPPAPNMRGRTPEGLSEEQAKRREEAMERIRRQQEEARRRAAEQRGDRE